MFPRGPAASSVPARVLLAAWSFLAVAPRAVALPPDIMQTAGGEIVAPRPAGAGWACDTAWRAADGLRVAEIRCKRLVGGADLRLHARDYDGRDETVEEICARDWRQFHGRLFSEISRVEVSLAPMRGERVCAILVDGASSARRPLQLREWYSVAPRRVRLVSAAGPSHLMRRHETIVNQWKDAVVFTSSARR
jgi:hypothetical protein